MEAREIKGLELFQAGAVHPLQEAGLFRVENGRGKTYIVDLLAGTCTCPDHTFRGATCKHLIAAQLYEAKMREALNAPIKETVWEEDVI